MRSFRFLLSRRWVLFAIAVAVLVCATWWLGNWQFGRLHDKRQSNDIVRTNEHAAPAPVGDVLAVGRSVAKDDEWRRVTATGTYDTAHTIVWRYRTDDHGTAGIDVVVPFVTKGGTALIVDRGWMASPDQDHDPETLPAPPSGTVTVTGWVRVDGTGDATRVDQVGGSLGTRAVSSRTIGPAIGRPVYGGFVNLEKEDPAPATELARVDMPELNDGPHLFYGIQWWFFGVLAVFGFFYLMYDERRSTLKAEASPEPQPAGETIGETAAVATLPDAAVTAAQTPATTAASRPEPRVDPRAERKARRTARNAHKQAVRAAYQAAYEQEKRARGGDEAQSERSMPPSTGTIAPETYDDAGESRNAATEPNSAGRP